MLEFLASRKDGIEAFATLVQIAAILVGGWWTYRAFIHGRISYPKAKGELVVTSVELHDGRQLVRVTLQLENVGTTIVQISKFFARLQQIDPPAIRRDGRAFEPQADPSTGEIAWPLIEGGEHNYDGPKVFREIEPGEADALNFDFVIPAEVRTVYVNCYVQNSRKRTRFDWRPGHAWRQQRNIGWEFASVHQLGAGDGQHPAGPAKTTTTTTTSAASIPTQRPENPPSRKEPA